VNYFTILSNVVEIAGFLRRSTERGLNASRAAEPDRHLIAVNNHRHRASALAEFEHAPQPRRVLLDVDVLERDLPPLKVVTGGLRIGSGVFAEDEDHVSILLRGQTGVRMGVGPPSDPIGDFAARELPQSRNCCHAHFLLLALSTTEVRSKIAD
jgi:hypothetical protein